MPLTYQAALAFLYPRVTTIKFGLDTTRALLARLGHPERHTPTVHIGGTNGKGSVAALVAGALAASGLRVGLYTSPHLASFRERITVDGSPIGTDMVAMWVEQLQEDVERLGATFFEATTAIALADFAARGADIAVVEVGLGGRLDSTNVLEPLVSGVTKIARDHMKYLGDTLEQIASEKAGIAKPGTPFVIGERDPWLAAKVREVAAQRIGSDAASLIRTVPPDQEWRHALALPGPHQRRNAAVAEALLASLPAEWQPSGEVIRAAFARTTVPGRLQRHGRWLFDVAHNPDGMQALAATIREWALPRPLHAVVSILGDKDWPEMLVTLDGVVDRGILTIAPSADTRRWSTDWLQEWLASDNRPPARARWSLVEDFDRALDDAAGEAGTILVTGSFHTVGDAMLRLGLLEPD